MYIDIREKLSKLERFIFIPMHSYEYICIHMNVYAFVSVYTHIHSCAFICLLGYQPRTRTGNTP